jgi:hypothetical protein
MASKKGKNKSKKGQGLSGVSQVMEHPVAQTVTKGGLVLLTAIAAGGAGAALGKHSLLAGVPLALIGYHRKNNYMMAAGLGLCLSNGFQNPNKTSAPVQGVDGFDMKQIAEEAKDRVGTFFKNFSEKLYLSKAEPTATSGLGESGKEEVTYFVNPYNSAKELDMSAIDRIQEQIANMGKGTNGMSAIEDADREF